MAKLPDGKLTNYETHRAGSPTVVTLNTAGNLDKTGNNAIHYQVSFITIHFDSILLGKHFKVSILCVCILCKIQNGKQTLS